MKNEKKNSGIISLLSGFMMIIASLINYFLNNDHISLGIFIFAGIGFIMLGIAERKEKKLSKRLKKYANIFFAISIIILIYWLLVGKLEIL